MKKWYVLNTHVHAETKAAFHIRRQGFECYLPRYMKRCRHARRIDHVPTPMFPRYLFARFDADNDQWRSLRSTIGVVSLIFQGERPAPLSEEAITEIQSREDERGMVALSAKRDFVSGDKVRIIEGALSEHVGLFDCADARRRVFVLLDLLGREVKVRLPMEAIASYG